MDFIKNFFNYNKHQIEQKYLNGNIFEQIKDFKHRNLTEEQNFLIDKLILNKELKEYYKKHGLCKECKQVNTGGCNSDFWCQSCNAKHFQQNFQNWTSGNPDVDKLIQKSQLNAKNEYEKLEWIEYEKFENIKYITKGGFGTIYKALWKDGRIVKWNYEDNQWKRCGCRNVALKSLNNSKDITLEFLNEIIKIYGITKDPKTSDFMIVMRYARNGNLRQKLNREFNSLNWKNKLEILRYITSALSDIHKEELTHQDFHSGNILNIGHTNCSVTDLGLSKPANEKHDKKVYGVLPYVAPEVLREKKYTKGSDVYSFGIIIYEVINGLPPYYDMAHEEFLAIKICQGLRPRFNIKVPQLINDIAKKCMDADPLKRPTAEYLYKIFDQWFWDLQIVRVDSEIYKQIKEADEFNEKQLTFTKSSISTELIYTTHPQAIYTSRLLNFNNLPEPRNADNWEEYSGI